MVQAKTVVVLQESRRELRPEVVITSVIKPTADDVLGGQNRRGIGITNQAVLKWRGRIEAARIPPLQVSERQGRDRRQFRHDRPA